MTFYHWFRLVLLLQALGYGIACLVATGSPETTLLLKWMLLATLTMIVLDVVYIALLSARGVWGDPSLVIFEKPFAWVAVIAACYGKGLAWSEVFIVSGNLRAESYAAIQLLRSARQISRALEARVRTVLRENDLEQAGMLLREAQGRHRREQKEHAQLLDRARRVGCEEQIQNLLSARRVKKAAHLLARVENLWRDAREVGVMKEVEDPMREGRWDDADVVIACGREKRQLQEFVAKMQLRLQSVPPRFHQSLSDSLAHVARPPFNSRPFRIAYHEFDLRLKAAEAEPR